MANEAWKTCEHCRSSKWFGVVELPDRMVIECTVCKATTEVVRIGATLPKPPPPPPPIIQSPQEKGGGDFVLRFGKHEGQTLQDVYDEDPSYLDWLIGCDDLRPSLKKALEDFLG